MLSGGVITNKPFATGSYTLPQNNLFSGLISMLDGKSKAATSIPQSTSFFGFLNDVNTANANSLIDGDLSDPINLLFSGSSSTALTGLSAGVTDAYQLTTSLPG